ncbi:glycosyltransferase family 4 protein [Pseudomonas helvetica]|uniref:glycosyltransferase family 4 protein n=1 Tax=Pseudomonas helvetica TaxID=3136738 RepID=UPI0032671F26
MKVLHVFKTYFPDTFGGIEQCIYQLCKGGEEFGVESQVLCVSTQRAGSLFYEGHRVHYARSNFTLLSTPFSLSAILSLRKLAAQVDIVHYHFPWPFMDVAHFLVQRDKPIVVSYHSDIVKQRWTLELYRPLMNRFLSSASAIVASSPNYLESSSVLQKFKDKVSVIPIGLDKRSFPVPAPERELHWRSNLPSRFFLFVGVLRYYKGLHTLLDAAKICGYPIVIAGSGPEEDNLKRQAVELGLTNIVFVGRVSDEDKVALLTLCTATVFPSHLRSEAFGISLLESAMYAKPMICCEIGTGTTYINVDQLTGFVVPPEDPAGLAVAMRKMWEDSNTSYAMGQAAFVRYKEMFTSESMARCYAELYRDLLSGG